MMIKQNNTFLKTLTIFINMIIINYKHDLDIKG